MSQPYFTPDAIQFLSDLQQHNNKEWFDRNRERFVSSLRDPYLRFLTDLAPRMRREVSPRFVVDSKPTGGSLARIHKDMRFAKDQLPFKTALSAHFAHENASEGAVPSFFIYIEPGNSFLGGGLRDPSGAAKKLVKKAIRAQSERYQDVTGGLEPDRFLLAHPLTDLQVTSDAFLEIVVANLRDLAPFVQFLTEAVGLDFTGLPLPVELPPLESPARM